MKFLLSILGCFILVVGLQNCMSSRKTRTKKIATTYSADVLPIIEAHCTPCHFPPGGNKLPLNTYAALKENINEVLERVQLDTADKHFMPFKLKKPALSESMIKTLKEWNAQAMPE